MGGFDSAQVAGGVRGLALSLVGAFRASVIWGAPLALILWLAWQWLAVA